MRILINARNRSVGVEHGVIVEALGKFDAVINAPDADLRPGLINAHDHLHRNHYGRLGRPPYRNAEEWARDIQRRYRARIERRHRRPRRQALLAGALKNLCSGVTTVVHHDCWDEEFDRFFPIRVARIACANSIVEAGRLDPSAPYCIHVAEGTDRKSGAEIAVLEKRGLLTGNLVAVHGVGLDPAATARFAESGAALVWCPSSNLFMLGRTASRSLLQSGADVILGSDSLLTGTGNLLDEIRFARALGGLDDAALERAVGSTAAARLQLAPPRLDIGAAADLILIRKPILEASARDVRLVMVAGVARVAASALAPALGRALGTPTRMRSGSVEQLVNIEQCAEVQRGIA